MATTHAKNVSIKRVKNDMIKAMKQAVVYFEHMVRTLKLRDESEPAQLLFKLRQAIEQAEKQEQGEPVAFKIYKPTPPRHAIPNVRDAELPWVYDQDPSSGNVASMWVTPVKATPPQRQWIGLTDEERIDIAYDAKRDEVMAVKLTEAKLRSKNT